MLEHRKLREEAALRERSKIVGASVFLRQSEEARQLCADPTVFQADASYTYEYLCYSMLSAEFAAVNCSAAGCYPSYHEDQDYCMCPSVTDSEACLAKLPGELSCACACACA